MKKKNKVEDNQVLSEEETRKRMLTEMYNVYGPEGVRQLRLMFAKYDDLLKRCTNQIEIEHIKKIACADVYKLVGYSGGLKVNGEVVIPAEEGISDENKS